MELFGEGGGSSPFIARSGMVDWGAVMDIDVRKCHAEGFVDSLQGVVENVARANIRTDLRFSQVRLFLLGCRQIVRVLTRCVPFFLVRCRASPCIYLKSRS